ncbi:Nif3-like dinuclear metal center hexameric protein [Ureaplasma canigenitalium]|uniref:Nif3-like dinuclear metal center hexameric protein n=1 Tax=Ureaplasma canigenitalium TaxID=42092 RepID=UPI0004E18553|nr:Nif3-like dinuclear metal center hexameric protein [Ureaplasma canigenitalium]
MKTNEILKTLYDSFKIKDGEEWDTNGIIFDFDLDIKKILITLELTTSIVDSAIKDNVNLIITHHPLKTEVKDDETKDWFINTTLIEKIKSHQISVISLHTAFDQVSQSITHKFAKLIELINIKQDPNNKYVFTGESKSEFGQDFWARKIRGDLGSPMITASDKFRTKKIHKFALVAGSGFRFSDYIFKNHDIDVFLTSDLKYHDWIEANEKNYNIMDVHHLSEYNFVDIIYDFLIKKISGVDLLKAEVPLRLAFY